jgi:3D (Asp-Asp-Asp) domain-containing protein
VIPAENTPLEADMVIQVIRVTERIETRESSIPYETIFQADETMSLDTRRTLQTGEDGIQQERVRTRLENGQEVSRLVLDSWQKHPPVPEVIIYGTQTRITERQVGGVQIQAWRVLPMAVTAYSPSLVGRSTTESGIMIQRGVVAVDPAVIPPGTRLYIEGYGEATAVDVLPSSKGLTIALGYQDSNIQPWTGTVQVYHLPPIPSEVPYLLEYIE